MFKSLIPLSPSKKNESNLESYIGSLNSLKDLTKRHAFYLASANPVEIARRKITHSTAALTDYNVVALKGINNKNAEERFYNFSEQCKYFGVTPFIRENSQTFFHLTGSKGKSSTARYIASLLDYAECFVLKRSEPIAVFTSPHHKTICERVVVNSKGNIKRISKTEFGDIYNEITDTLKKQNKKLSYFELVTLVYYLYCKEHKIKNIVTEVGIGGRLDSTQAPFFGPTSSNRKFYPTLIPLKLDKSGTKNSSNDISRLYKPKNCAITNIELEHQAILGPTLPHIAYEKLGIIGSAELDNISVSELILNNPAKNIATDAVANKLGYGSAVKRAEKSVFDASLKIYENLLVNVTNREITGGQKNLFNKASDHMLDEVASMNFAVAVDNVWKSLNKYQADKLPPYYSIDEFISGYFDYYYSREGINQRKYYKTEFKRDNLNYILDGAHTIDSITRLIKTINESNISNSDMEGVKETSTKEENGVCIILYISDIMSRPWRTFVKELLGGVKGLKEIAIIPPDQKNYGLDIEHDVPDVIPTVDKEIIELLMKEKCEKLAGEVIKIIKAKENDNDSTVACSFYPTIEEFHNRAKQSKNIQRVYVAGSIHIIGTVKNFLTSSSQ